MQNYSSPFTTGFACVTGLSVLNNNIGPAINASITISRINPIAILLYHFYYSPRGFLKYGSIPAFALYRSADIWASFMDQKTSRAVSVNVQSITVLNSKMKGMAYHTQKTVLLTVSYFPTIKPPFLNSGNPNYI